MSSANTFSAVSQFSGPSGATGPSGPTGVADYLVINEVYYDSDSLHLLDNERFSEWVEIYNPTDSQVDLTDWTLTDNNGPESLSGNLPSGGFILVIATNSASFQTKWTIPAGVLFHNDENGIGGSSGLSNAGDFLILKNSGVEVDKMSWGNVISGFTTGCSSVCPAVSAGRSLERNPDGFDTGDSSDFITMTTPSPGQ